MKWSICRCGTYLHALCYETVRGIYNTRQRFGEYNGVNCLSTVGGFYGGVKQAGTGDI